MTYLQLVFSIMIQISVTKDDMYDCGLHKYMFTNNHYLNLLGFS